MDKSLNCFIDSLIEHKRLQFSVDQIHIAPDEFEKSVINKKEALKLYATDALGLSCVRYLAHSYFKNEILPEEWRALMKDQSMR
ncbi:hypothetical protein [Chryseobacterium sp. WX]|uniref:hypothetical protein n=1 Tax=Chryseobacterium sp. WX TaxID=3031803 RepID=UPI0024090059|nr:hypothetical protein [Chryseobacterium sp. WX]WFB69101.1 hypothetical protein PZ898_06685 [Chryseobacterium sp. WX]